MDHINGVRTDGSGSQMSLYITSTVNTSGTVSVADGSFSTPYTVTANQVTEVPIPSGAFLGDIQGQSLKGIHIVSAKPVAVYAHIYAAAISGATLLLPVSALGKEYYSINYTQLSNSLTQPDEAKPSYSTFMVIATEDNTTVEITPSATLLDNKPLGVPYIISLKKGEVYQGLSLTDLTGTRIRSISSTGGSCTRIAVFSGSSKIGIGCGSEDQATSDNLFQQVYSTATWGKNYVTIPLKDRPYDIFRIVVNDPTTKITLNGSSFSVINGRYYEFTSTKPNIISADKPIQVVQYAVTQGKTADCQIDYYNGDVGDPEMIYLNPIEQTIDNITLYSTSRFRILKNYINVLIKTDAASTFTIDGVPYAGFKTLPGNPAYSYAQMPVNSGAHHIKASDGFNAIAYGFGDRESYGYAAGANLKNLNEFIILNDQASSVTYTNGCTGVNYTLQLTLPFQTTSIKWDFKDGATPFTDTKPAVKNTIVKDGVTLYVYEYQKTIKYNVGDYAVVATVFNPTSDNCGSYQDIEYDFNVSNPPTAKFDLAGNCAGDITTFKDASDAGNNSIKTWAWDFGDGQTAIVQNPRHTYTTKGDYLVRLTVGNENECLSTYTQTIHVIDRPAALFKHSTPDCAGGVITFTDTSVPNGQTIIQWVWDYGDGTPPETRTDNKPFTHAFPNVGISTVKLFVVTANGCSSEVYAQDITISPFPVVDFNLPDVCAGDFAMFTDNSTIADGTALDFTYSWNFGDAQASTANANISTEKDPKHRYLKEGDYQVTLTVTSRSGCSFSTTKTVTVNGNVISAKFNTENTANLCSSQDVVFDDLSTLNFGNITKVVWFFDYNNHPDDGVVFQKGDIPSDHKFHHNYGAFNTPATQNYSVVLRVFSGESCFDQTVPQTIVLKSNPVVDLVPPGTICDNGGPVQLAVDNHGFQGTGVFSGTGISASGMFDPAVAGVGVTTINYTFTSQSGCDYATSEPVTVSPSPKITVESDMAILEGGQATIKATVSGSNLQYQWIPATGLSRSDILDPVISPTTDTKYKLIVSSENGCSSTVEVFVKVFKTPVIPNAFTPNGDGTNDTWNIKYLETYPANLLQVYNRSGQRVYSSVGYAIPWDGRYNGSYVPAGTYYYVIDLKNGEKMLSGYVTIIR